MSRVKSNVRLLDPTISVKWLKFSNSHHFHSSFLSLSCLLPNPVNSTALQRQNLIGKVHPNIINTPQQRIHFHILLRVIDSISQLQPPSPPAVIVINLATFFWAGKKSWRRSTNYCQVCCYYNKKCAFHAMNCKVTPRHWLFSLHYLCTSWQLCRTTIRHFRREKFCKEDDDEDDAPPHNRTTMKLARFVRCVLPQSLSRMSLDGCIMARPGTYSGGIAKAYHGIFQRKEVLNATRLQFIPIKENLLFFVCTWLSCVYLCITLDAENFVSLIF